MYEINRHKFHFWSVAFDFVESILLWFGPETLSVAFARQYQPIQKINF